MEIKKQIYIIVSVFALASLFLVLFFIYPIMSEISGKSAELVSYRDKGLSLDGQFNEAANFKQKYEDYKSNLEKADNLCIDSQNPVYFIEFLEKTASELGLQLQISTPTQSMEGNMTFQNIQLSSTGGFSQTIKFANELEAGPFLINIQRINMTSQKNDDEQKLVKSDILIKVFSKPN
jgi:hypothetical protein